MFVYREWEKVCQLIQKTELNVVTASEAVNLVGGGLVVVKHDVETDVKRAYDMACIEKKYNICATYYVQSYLLTDKNIWWFSEMKKMGHEITYHYDVLDRNAGNWNLAVAEFQDTLDKFKRYGFEVKTVCPHGNPVRIRNGWNSNKDFFRKPEIQNRWKNIHDIVIDPKGIVGEPFEYISDAGFGWKLIKDISNNDLKGAGSDSEIQDLLKYLSSIKSSGKSLILSSHPHRWRKNIGAAKFNKFRFYLIRWVGKKLASSKLVRPILNKFYYLAKKL